MIQLPILNYCAICVIYNLLPCVQGYFLDLYFPPLAVDRDLWSLAKCHVLFFYPGFPLRWLDLLTRIFLYCWGNRLDLFRNWFTCLKFLLMKFVWIVLWFSSASFSSAPSAHLCQISRWPIFVLWIYKFFLRINMFDSG